jgi:hypothetical protein
MKSYWTGAVLASVLVLAAGAQAEPAPKLLFSQPSWDFGEVWHTETPTLTLTIKNEGDAELILAKVRTTCGCTAAQPAASRVPPGGSTTVKVQYDTHGKQDAVESKVIVETNDPRTGAVIGNVDPNPRRGEAHFPIKGFIKRAITRKPLGGLVVKGLGAAPGHTGEVVLENMMPEPMKLELAKNGLHEADLEIREISAGRVYKLVAKTNRELKPGALIRGDIELKTGLEREPNYTVNARIQILEMVEPSPSTILLQPNDEVQQRVVSFQYYGKEGPANFKITGWQCDNKDVKVNIENTQPPQPWMTQLKPPITAEVRATISCPAARTLPTTGALVVFTTNDPECPKVDILITADKPSFELRMHGRFSGEAPASAPAPAQRP